MPVGAGTLGFLAGGAVAVVFARTLSLTYLPAYLLGVLILTQPWESVPVTVVPTGILPTRTELVAGLVRTFVVWNVERVTVVEVAAGAARLTAALPATVPPRASVTATAKLRGLARIMQFSRIQACPLARRPRWWPATDDGLVRQRERRESRPPQSRPHDAARCPKAPIFDAPVEDVAATVRDGDLALGVTLYPLHRQSARSARILQTAPGDKFVSPPLSDLRS